MLIRLLAVAVTVSFLAVACGGGPSRRTLVTRYIESVNVIEQELAGPLLEVSKANRDFARNRSSSASIRQRLRRSRARMHVLAARLGRLPAPTEAKRLRALLLGLVHGEQELSGEMEQLVIFVPRFQRALKPLAPADAQLKPVLASKVSPRVKARALDTFAGQLGAVRAELEKLHPPPPSRPVWSQQISTLDGVGTSAEALAKALRKGRVHPIPKLIHAVDLAALSNQSLAAQRAQIAAITAYNGRIKRLGTLASRVVREQRRLERDVH